MSSLNAEKVSRMESGGDVKAEAAAKSDFREHVVIHKSQSEVLQRATLRSSLPDLRQYQKITCEEVRTRLLNGNASYIWDFSDSSAWFISGLYHNNPSERRKQLETLVQMPPLPHTPPSTDSLLNTTKISGPFSKQRNGSVSVFHYPGGGIVLENSELTEIVRKMLELTTDMMKSVQIVYHAVRACAKFLSFPTPSIPSDNYVFGQLRGWLWLIYKAIAYLNPEPGRISECVQNLHGELSGLLQDVEECIADCTDFNETLKKLQKELEKEIKFLKSKGGVWELKMRKYFRHVEAMRKRNDVLIDLNEDRYFSSDWIFDPQPEQMETDCLHFQWIRMDRDVEFEVRSDFSTRWIAFSKFDTALKIDILNQMIVHLKAMVNEAKAFTTFHIHLTFGYNEFRCLQVAVNELAKKMQNNRTISLISTTLLEFFQDFANLLETSLQFQGKLVEVSNLIGPMYSTVKRWSQNFPVEPLNNERYGEAHAQSGCCTCKRRSHLQTQFVDLYGEPMAVILLRTPIAHEITDKYFRPEKASKISRPNAVDKFGVSRGYQSSVFDKVLGRDPPVKPIRILKSRRKPKDITFDVFKLSEHSRLCLSSDPGDIDLEEYILIFDQVMKFFLRLGRIFTWINAEVESVLEILEELVYGPNANNYDTVLRMVIFEMIPVKIQETGGGAKGGGNSKSLPGCKTVVRLHLFLRFVAGVGEKLLALEEHETTYYAFKSSYNSTLSTVHSWVTQKVAAISFYSLPNKKDLYERSDDSCPVAEFDSFLATTIHDLKEILTLTKKIINDNCPNNILEIT